jgi:hypothetical protein
MYEISRFLDQSLSGANLKPNSIQSSLINK